MILNTYRRTSLKYYCYRKRRKLAPTHSSIYDFLLISYVLFSIISEAQIDFPYIAAVEDFVSSFLITVNLFYQRDRGLADKQLDQQTFQMNFIAQRR
jgi:hypothetical protein